MSTTTTTTTTTVPVAVTLPSSDCATAVATTTANSTSLLPGVAQHTNFKNRLQEFAQRVSIPLPVYQTVSVNGTSHPAQFRSFVAVDGETYTSNIFSNKKGAEQDAAKLALEGIDKKIKDCMPKKTNISGFPPVFQDKVFCKTIFHEFATKMKMERPKYETVRTEAGFPVFITSVFFNGVKYVGAPSVTKKEAEQLAARNAILSILGDSGIGTQLSEVVKSKAKLFSILHEEYHVNEASGVPCVQPNAGASLDTSAMKGDCLGSQTGSATENVEASVILEQSLSRKSDLEGVDGAGNVFGDVVSGVLEGQSHAVPKHEFRKPGVGTLSQAVPLPIAFVPALGDQTPLSACGKKRKPKKKKKANKKAKIGTETPLSELPLSQGMS